MDKPVAIIDEGLVRSWLAYLEDRQAAIAAEAPNPLDVTSGDCRRRAAAVLREATHRRPDDVLAAVAIADAWLRLAAVSPPGA